MLHIIISRIIAWLYEVGRVAYIQDRDEETNFWCDVDRYNLMRVLNLYDLMHFLNRYYEAASIDNFSPARHA